MKIEVKHWASWVGAVIVEDNTRIDLGLMDNSERDALAETMLNAVFEIGPTSGCAEWFFQMMDKCGIEAPEGYYLK